MGDQGCRRWSGEPQITRWGNCGVIVVYRLAGVRRKCGNGLKSLIGYSKDARWSRWFHGVLVMLGGGCRISR